MHDLSEAHVNLMLSIIRNPGAKLGTFETRDSEGDPLWTLLEERGLIRVVGSYEWEPTGIALMLVRSSFAPGRAIQFFADLQNQNELLRMEIEDLKGDLADSINRVERAREERNVLKRLMTDRGTPGDEDLGSNDGPTARRAAQDARRRTQLREVRASLRERNNELYHARLWTVAWSKIAEYLLGVGHTAPEHPLDFFHLWRAGDFGALRKRWPNAPDVVYLLDPKRKEDGWYEDEEGTLRYWPGEVIDRTTQGPVLAYTGIAAVPSEGTHLLEKGEQVSELQSTSTPAQQVTCDAPPTE